jgi:hypothetical protein
MHFAKKATLAPAELIRAIHGWSPGQPRAAAALLAGLAIRRFRPPPGLSSD